MVPDWTRGSSPGGALKTRRCSGLDFLFRIAPHRALKTGRYYKSDQKVCLVLYTVLLSAHVERVSVSRMQDFFYAYANQSWYINLLEHKTFNIWINIYQGLVITFTCLLKDNLEDPASSIFTNLEDLSELMSSFSL